MKRILIALICMPAFAFAEEAAKPAPMEMPKPGAEHKALAPFFGVNTTWTGKMVAGAMGPGSPEMPTKGKQNCKAAMGGFSYMCDVEDIAGSGKQAMHWKGHFLIGWDASSKSYKAFGVDNMGGMAAMKGELAGKKLTFTSVEPITMMGMTFTDEHQMQGSNEWKVVEETAIKPAAAK